MAIERLINTNEDAVKRGKLLVLAFLISISIFIQTVFRVNDGDPIRVGLTALIYFIVSIGGLIWAFNFQVKFKSILFLIQSALFVASEYLFIELFFIQRFSRIYEGLLLLVLVGLVFLGTYISFLMANIFNVNLYKEIPLINVARTVCYIISTFTLLFLLFGLLALQTPIYVLLPVVFVISLFLSYVHLKNLGFVGILLNRKTLMVSLLVFFMFLSSFLSSSTHEISVLSPVVGYFVGIGIANMKSTDTRKTLQLILYIFILIAITVINLNLNIFR